MDNQFPEAEQTRHHRQPLVLPFKTRASIFLLNAITDATSRHNVTVNRRLLSLINNLSCLNVPPNPKPRGGVKTSDVTVDHARNLWFRLFVPIRSDPHLPVVVFFHGGGFVYLAADFKAYDAVCRRFAREINAVVVSVNYRLAPEHRYPAQYEDGFDVLKFLDEQRDVLPGNADMARCFLAGDSAGGNIAHHVGKRASESKFTHLKVLGLVMIQPFFGGEERTTSEKELAEIDSVAPVKRADWMWKAFIPPEIEMDRDHEDINVSGPNAADISNIDFPATMVAVAGFDSLKDRQLSYYEWLKKSGKEAYLLEYKNTIHAFYIFPELSESGDLISEVKQFIQSQCSKAFNVE